MAESLYYIDPESMDLSCLEKIVAECPWYVYGRLHMLRMKYEADSGERDISCLRKLLRKDMLFLPCKAENLEIPARRETSRKKESKPDMSVYVAGGDYFSKDDFASLENGYKNNIFKPGGYGDRSGSSSSAEIFPGEEKGFTEEHIDVVNKSSDDFCTETLAEIYVQQQHYEEAISAYSKLSLLYPEKSAYFADLINEIKSKNK
ncbi:MAG: hypothetical protein LKI53_09350 [Bacteroidales bacterium]|jgi:hypothetical protein|nr:hypothetical protein [Bacteroidales bacterium]